MTLFLIRTFPENRRATSRSNSQTLLVFSFIVFVTAIFTQSGCTSVQPTTKAVDPKAAATQMIQVRSKDGTLIAAECAGSGPTLIIVHGGIGDRTRWTPMFPWLSSQLRVCAMDRRGRGASGDSPDYNLQKEAEDVAALAGSRDGIVYVLGHSYGGVAALEATFLTDRISKLILYEPPLQDPGEHILAVADTIEKMILEGDREQAVVTFLREVGKQSESEIAAVRSKPSWPNLVATVDSHPRQMRALATYTFDKERISTVKIPVLLLIGSKTESPYIRQATKSLTESLPDPTLKVLQDQQHNAMDNDRQQLADAINQFLVGTNNPSRK